jgi:Zn-dependent peptidase ImmA (M78 family)
MSNLEEQERGYKAARVARAELGLGLEAPLADVLEVIEDLAGVPVAVLELGSGVAGLHGRKQDRDFIFLNGDDAAPRLRFTLAHEYGHVRLHHASSVDRIEDVECVGRRAPTEAQADGFAAEFLAPVSAVRAWLAAAGDPEQGLETTVRLAHYFHVSAPVALYRLQAARFLTRGQMAPVQDAIGANEHGKLARRLGLEDIQDTVYRARTDLPRFPRSTLTHALSAYERGLLTVDQIAALLEVGSDRITAELGRRGAAPPVRQPDY